ncbi:hypothetical protein DSM21852_15530 [Methylocystis bryophila]|uniref:CdiI immunity protein domain-containing protein n=2 Tax=Methylocystis bryophila TaxID=655015 RepID=A0A1W6MXC3_9HYPH|nr:hypothetical protein B1812_14960 [Methylocystis bryophila]BDV38300.1 hypothetical protein DSM21852_15530 [Methylocystis bryophila]
MPKEFVELCIWFQPGVTRGHETAEQVIDDALSNANLSVPKLNVVSAYLSELLSGKYNDEELHRIWRTAGAGVSITSGQEGDSARFLRKIRSAIDALDRRSTH